MENNNSKIAEYYDSYTSYQLSSGINRRHRSIMARLIAAGLNDTSTILEIGCWIGSLTQLLSGYVSRGTVLSIDISPESVKIAQSRNLLRKNVRFITGNILETDICQSFDFILLADVLEHIPITEHKQLFKRLSSLMHPRSLLAINIPDPHYLEFVRTHTPEQLQIIDQSIYSDSLIVEMRNVFLTLVKLERYSVWIEQGDYQWILATREPKITTVDEITGIKRILYEMRSRFWRIQNILESSLRYGWQRE